LAAPNAIPDVPSPQAAALTVEPESEAKSEPLDFEGIFAKEFDYVWHTLRRLGVRPADVEDLTHDVFLAVYQRRDDYDPARPLRPWLFGFAFRVTSRYRNRSRYRLELLAETDEVAGESRSAYDDASLRQQVDVATRAIAALELDRRAVFILHELDEFAMPEVAAALEIPLNTAYSRLRLARAELAAAVRRLRLRGFP
jgi:RNA polymerase sigma-70 factor (ECF subfamily)